MTEQNTKRVKIRVHKSAYTDVRTLYRNDLKEALKKQAKQIFEDLENGCYRISDIKKKWLK